MEDIEERPYCIMRYKNKTYPQVSLKIGDIEINDILFDTGLNDYLVLCEKDLKKILQRNRYQSRNSVSLFNAQNSFDIQQFVFDTLAINDKTYDNVSIAEWKQNIIGCGFIKQFSALYLDTKNQTIHFYK